MAKFTGMILCNGGYSSSLVSAKLNELGKEYDMEFHEGGLGAVSMEELADKFDLVLLAPHLAMYYDDYIDEYEEKGTPLYSISPKEYVVTNVPQLWERIKADFKDKI